LIKADSGYPKKTAAKRNALPPWYILEWFDKLEAVIL
jgi:hypothetical protein